MSQRAWKGENKHEASAIVLEINNKEGSFFICLSLEITFKVRQMCKIAFKQLDIIRITGMVYEENISSRKVLEKNDFVLEGIMKQAVYKNGVVHNLCVYGKYLEE